MLQPKTFLAVPISVDLEAHLEKANPYLLSLFLKSGEYLQEHLHENQRYIGKYTSASPTFEELEALHTHIVSILHKLAPKHVIETSSVLIAK